MLGSIGKVLRSYLGPKPKVTSRIVTRVDTELKLGAELGSGRFGIVRRAITRRPMGGTPTGTEVAVKTVSKSRGNLHELCNEVKILQRLDQLGGNSHVTQLLDAFEDSKSVYLVSPLYGGGELFDRILEQRVFTEMDASRYMADLMHALQFCHSNLVVHRDISRYCVQYI